MFGKFELNQLIVCFYLIAVGGAPAAAVQTGSSVEQSVAPTPPPGSPSPPGTWPPAHPPCRPGGRSLQWGSLMSEGSRPRP